MAIRIGYLGPQGTFTEEALLSAIPLEGKELVSYSTEQEVIYAVERKEADKGIVPIENSIEGSVNVTLDMLTFEASLLIEREIITPIRHYLISSPGMSLKDVSLLISHPQATAQCRGYLAGNLPNIPVVAANSTAEAVKRAAEEGRTVAAIGTRLAAELNGLVILDSDIQDFKDNKTRFVIVGREAAPRTGNDKTSMVCFIYEDRPGSLLQILQEFAYRYINLTKIQSRPTKKALGDYCFWIDMEGHLEDEAIASAIKCLRCKLRDVKVLGSYPKADKT
ncbi:MAG: prephenate dehydratase [Actinomycetota bacterium]|nr:prephenate dehydratase [Actinomycetota bacterium]